MLRLMFRPVFDLLVVLPFLLAGAAWRRADSESPGARAVDRLKQAQASVNSQDRYQAENNSWASPKKCQEALEGWPPKLQVMDTDMRRFATSFGQLKNVKLTDVPSMAAFPQAGCKRWSCRALGLKPSMP